jgi:hypothetical protein
LYVLDALAVALLSIKNWPKVDERPGHPSYRVDSKAGAQNLGGEKAPVFLITAEVSTYRIPEVRVTTKPWL